MIATRPTERADREVVIEVYAGEVVPAMSMSPGVVVPDVSHEGSSSPWWMPARCSTWAREARRAALYLQGRGLDVTAAAA